MVEYCVKVLSCHYIKCIDVVAVVVAAAVVFDIVIGAMCEYN